MPLIFASYVPPVLFLPLGHKMFHTSEFEVVLWNITQIKSPCGEICPRPPRFPTKTTGSSFIVFFWRCRGFPGRRTPCRSSRKPPFWNPLELTRAGMLTVTGQIRSHNVRTDGRRHLMIFVFASALTCEDGEALNDAVLEGFLCREPIYRRTPSGAGDLRRDAGGAEGVPAGGLPALHPLGQDGAGGFPVPHPG